MPVGDVSSRGVGAIFSGEEEVGSRALKEEIGTDLGVLEIRNRQIVQDKVIDGNTNINGCNRCS